jgi:hypothetical protein
VGAEEVTPYEPTWVYLWISPASRSWHRRHRPDGDAATIADRGGRVIASGWCPMIIGALDELGSRGLIDWSRAIVVGVAR